MSWMSFFVLLFFVNGLIVLRHGPDEDWGPVRSLWELTIALLCLGYGAYYLLTVGLP
jgi:uncharacterized membrane protein